MGAVEALAASNIARLFEMQMRAAETLKLAREAVCDAWDRLREMPSDENDAALAAAKKACDEAERDYWNARESVTKAELLAARSHDAAR